MSPRKIRGSEDDRVPAEGSAAGSSRGGAQAGRRRPEGGAGRSSARSSDRAAQARPIRVLIAKPGLDGHDRGAKVVALALRQAGFEVIYSGLHQTVEEIVEAASQEDVAVLGLSVLSGAHLPIAEKLMSRLQRLRFRPLVLFGGNIPQSDLEALRSLEVDGVFPTGSRFEDIVSFIRQRVALESAAAGSSGGGKHVRSP